MESSPRFIPSTFQKAPDVNQGKFTNVYHFPKQIAHQQDNPKEKHLWNQNTTNASISGYLGVFPEVSRGHSLDIAV